MLGYHVRPPVQDSAEGLPRGPQLPAQLGGYSSSRPSRPATHSLFMCFNNLSGPFLGLYTYSDTSFSLKISHPLGEENGRGSKEEIRERDYNNWAACVGLETQGGWVR